MEEESDEPGLSVCRYTPDPAPVIQQTGGPSRRSARIRAQSVAPSHIRNSGIEERSRGYSSEPEETVVARSKRRRIRKSLELEEK